MKNKIKLIVISVFGLGALVIFLGSADLSRMGSVFAMAAPTPKPKPTPKAKPTPVPTAAPANVVTHTNTAPANTATNTAPVTNTNTAPATNTTPAANTVKPSVPSAGDKHIPKTFTMGKDSLSEYGEVAFDHDTHAFGNYSPDGKSPMGCIECHHTDQPKSALKLPLVTSERDVVMTFDTWKVSSQKVSDCRSCHFQDGNVPDGKEMPSATYPNGKKELTNELAYHINCNTCHDAAFKLRPELKKKPGFATTKDCTVCHKSN